MTRLCTSRRRFLQAGTGLVACGGMQAVLPQFNLMSNALAQTFPAGYKAMVCLYLNGGNDSWNLLMPADATRNDLYVTARNGLFNPNIAGNSGLAIPRPDGTGFIAGQTLPIALALNGGQYGLNPFAPELATLFNENKLAFVANVGTLFEPLTRGDYGNRRKPPQLYSHSDQTNLWQIGSSSSSGVATGFGGMIAGNVALPSIQTQGLPPVITIAGQNRFLNGETIGGQPLTPFALSTSTTAPASTLNDYNSTSATRFQSSRRAALEELFAASNPALFATEHKTILDRSLDLAERVINPGISGIPANDPVNGGGSPSFTWPTTSIGNQLRQVARMIRISQTTPISANRQVFYVSQSGYDTHDNQITSATAAVGHHALLQQLSQAVLAFQRAMEAIGSTNDVTLFTLSDFGRTINSNGDGTDHAWGSVQFALGGSVTGGQVYGRYPSIVLDTNLNGTNAANAGNGECFSRGQFIPTTAVDQFGATLARWMGVSNTDLPLIFPNIDNFVSGQYASAGASPTFANFNRIIPGMMAGVT